jgi:Protein HRI1
MPLPAISERKSIRWVRPLCLLARVVMLTVPGKLPDRAKEPTSTLVLMSRNLHFVDLRILKPLNPSEPDLPNEGGPNSRLEWAFSGVAKYTELPGCVHAEWSHEIDSRANDPDKDEGDLIPQHDGSVLEIGRMVNPATGKMTEYEEVWADLEVEVIGEDSQRISIVIAVVDDLRGIKGKIVRVGQWCQGISKVGTVTHVERWHWVGKKQGTMAAGKGKHQSDGSWERVAKIGGAYIPCSLAFVSGTQLNGAPAAEEGDELKVGDTTWRVIEKYVW